MGLRDWISKKWKAAGDEAASLEQGATQKLHDAKQWVGNTATDLEHGAAEKIHEVKNWAGNTVTNIENGASQKLHEVENWAGNTVTNIENGASQKLHDAENLVSNTAAGISGGLSQKWHDVKHWIGKKITGYEDDAANWVKRKIAGIARSAGQAAMDGLKSALPSDAGGLDGLLGGLMGGDSTGQGSGQQGGSTSLFGGGIMGLILGVFALIAELLLAGLKGLLGLFGMGNDSAPAASTDNVAQKAVKTVQHAGNNAYQWAGREIDGIAKSALVLKNKVSIDTDGSGKDFNPNTKAGRIQILSSGPSGFVQAAKGGPNSAEFTFSNGKTLNLALNANGSFVSKTSLQDRSFSSTDQRRYVDSEEVPFMALSVQQAKELGVKLGDRLVLTNMDNGMRTTAIYGDSAGSHRAANHLEMSPAAARQLGVNVDTRRFPDVDNMALKVEAFNTVTADSTPASGKKRPTGIA